jgi:hypothetical protein
MKNKSGKAFMYSVLAIIPLGIPIGLLIYAIRNRKDLRGKIQNFKLRIL